MSVRDLEIILLIVSGLAVMALFGWLAKRSGRSWRKFRLGFFIEREYEEKDDEG